MPRVTSAERAAEMNTLIVEQGHATRSVKYGWKPTPEEQAVINARAERLVELVELLDAHVAAPGYPLGEQVTPERYVNDRIAAWMRANPLALTNHRMLERLEENTRTGNLDASNTCGVTVQIGEDSAAYHYAVMADDFVALRGGGRVLFRVPESVAEHFRQQGRRALQSELRALLNASRA